MAVTAAQAAQAIRDKKGIVSQAAKQLGISRVQLHRLINRHPSIKVALTDAREELKDFAESRIYKGIADGNVTLLIFYAKTQMKDRGYVERQEVEHGGEFKIKVEYGDRTNGQPPETTSETN
jgi:hypothetical protein